MIGAMAATSQTDAREAVIASGMVVESVGGTGRAIRGGRHCRVGEAPDEGNHDQAAVGLGDRLR